MKTEPGKDTTLETLRGAAIILVVIGHVIGSGPDGGMKVSDSSWLRYIYFTFIALVQMPLFTAIAGYVYAFRPTSYPRSADFIIKKAWRILVPMLVVGTSYFLLQYVTPGTNKKGELSEIWRLLFFPYTLFWYLYSLFLAFVVIAIVDSFNLMKTFTNWLIIFIASLFLLLFRDTVIPFYLPNYLSYKGAIYLLPCFILGVGLNRFKTYFQSRSFNNSLLIILICGVIIQQLTWFGQIDYTINKDRGIGLMIGLSATVLLLRIRIKANWLTWFGSFAYSIYLFHAFGTAGARIIARQLNIQLLPLLFLLSMVAGLSLPVMAELFFRKFNITRLLFLGQTAKPADKLYTKYHPNKNNLTC